MYPVNLERNYLVMIFLQQKLDVPCKFRKKLSCYDISSAKINIIDITMEDLKNKLIKFIRESLDKPPLNVL